MSNSRPFHFLRVSLLLLMIGALVGPFGLLTDTHAQEGPSLQSTQRPIRVAIDPTYQYYETDGGQGLTQLSSRLSAFVPIGQRFSMQASTNYAQMGGDNLEQVRGPTDVTAGLTYSQPVADGSVVFSVRGNAPTGKASLEESELETTRLISRNFYDFRVSSFSRGLSVSPQVTWAFPIGDQFAVGIGGGYQYQAGFRPQASLDEDYVPGDGIGVNAGFDYKVTDASALGLDVRYRRYETDEIGGAPQFDAGSRISGTLRYLVQSGFTRVRVLVGYTSWEKSEFRFQRETPVQRQVLPAHGMAMTSLQTRLTDGVRFHIRASGHWYGETVGVDRKMFGRGYISPSFEISDALSLEPHGTVSYGSYLGVGGGLRIAGEF